MDFFEIYMETLIQMMKNLQAELTPEYIQSSTILCWVVGVVLAAMIIAAVIISKKNYAIGIATAIAQLANAVCCQKFLVHKFLTTDFLRVNIIYYSSEADLQMQMQELLTETLMDMLPILIASSLYMITIVLTVIFIIACLRCKLKVFSILALVLQILRYMWLPPFFLYGTILGPITQTAQQTYDYVYHGIALLNILLVFIPCLVTGLTAKKTESLDATAE